MSDEPCVCATQWTCLADEHVPYGLGTAGPHDPHAPEIPADEPMGWPEIEERLRTADQAAVHAVYAHNQRLEDLIAANGAELERLRAELAAVRRELDESEHDWSVESARLRAEVERLRALDEVAQTVARHWDGVIRDTSDENPLWNALDALARTCRGRRDQR